MPAGCVTGNIISANKTSVCTGGKVVFIGVKPTGGTGTYSYAWYSSSDGINFSTYLGNYSVAWTSAPLTSTTWFKRRVTSGTCVDYSNVILITVSSGTPASVTPTGPSSATSCDANQVYSVVPSFEALQVKWTVTGAGNYIAAINGTPTGVTNLYTSTVAVGSPNNITVHFASNGTVQSSMINGCGTSVAGTMTVTFGACARTSVAPAAIVQPQILDAIIYPNPANYHATVQFNSTAVANYRLSLIDLIGKEVIAKEGVSAEGTNMIELDLGNLSKGIYLMNLRSGDEAKTIRLVVD
jgi:hypothetical protein